MDNLKDSKKTFFTAAVTHNPVLIEAIGLAPILAVAVSAKSALMLSVLTACCLFITEALTCTLLKKFPNYIRTPFYLLIGTVITLGVMWIAQKFFPDFAVGLGLFLPLTAVSSLIALHCERFALSLTLKETMVHTAGSAVGYSAVTLIAGIIREILSKGTVFGINLGIEKISESFALPFFAFVILGFMAAILKAVLGVRYENENADKAFMEHSVLNETEEHTPPREIIAKKQKIFRKRKSIRKAVIEEKNRQKEEQLRIINEKKEKERLEAEQKAREKAQQLALLREQAEKEEQQRLAMIKEQQEKERIENERIRKEQERIALEQERITKEHQLLEQKLFEQEQERIRKEQLEKEAEQRRLAMIKEREKQELERLQKEKQEQELLKKKLAQEEKRRILLEEQEKKKQEEERKRRLEKEQAEAKKVSKAKDKQRRKSMTADERIREKALADEEKRLRKLARNSANGEEILEKFNKEAEAAKQAALKKSTDYFDLGYTPQGMEKEVRTAEKTNPFIMPLSEDKKQEVKK